MRRIPQPDRLEESGEKLNRWVLAQLNDTLKDIEGGFPAKTHNFLDLAGQLRFQQRWTKSPRIPATSATL